MRIRHIILQIVAYTLYALMAFMVFVYVMFPYDILQQRLVEWVAQDGVQLGLQVLALLVVRLQWNRYAGPVRRNV